MFINRESYHQAKRDRKLRNARAATAAKPSWIPDVGDGVDRSAGGPIGGTVIPTQTYTGFQDFETGADGKSRGINGGEAINMPTPTKAEQLLARPDLVDPRQSAVQQYELSAPVTPVQSISNQMKANALRNAGDSNG
jgi:hypothetical protein